MDEIQEVYRLQGVNINDKHIEVVVRQMMRWVKIEEVGDTEFLIDEVVDKFRFLSENERISSLGKKPEEGLQLGAGVEWSSMARLPRPVTIRMSSIPLAIASSTTNWRTGLSTMGSISFGS